MHINIYMYIYTHCTGTAVAVCCCRCNNWACSVPGEDSKRTVWPSVVGGRQMEVEGCCGARACTRTVATAASAATTDRDELKRMARRPGYGHGPRGRSPCVCARAKRDFRRTPPPPAHRFASTPRPGPVGARTSPLPPPSTSQLPPPPPLQPTSVASAAR